MQKCAILTQLQQSRQQLEQKSCDRPNLFLIERGDVNAIVEAISKLFVTSPCELSEFRWSKELASAHSCNFSDHDQKASCVEERMVGWNSVVALQPIEKGTHFLSLTTTYTGINPYFYCTVGVTDRNGIADGTTLTTISVSDLFSRILQGVVPKVLGWTPTTTAFSFPGTSSALE